METNSGEARSKPMSPEKAQEKLNILVVDDDPQMRSTIRILVEDGPVASHVDLIEEAGDGKMAFDILENNPGKFNVLLTDGAMPEMNGLDLCSKIKESGHKLVVVFISGGINGLDLNDAETQASLKEKYGITIVLPKPFGFEQFSGVLNQIKNVVEATKAVVTDPSSSSA